MNLPKSVYGELPSEAKSSTPLREQTAFGNGAKTKVRATKSGSQFAHSAQDRMTRRNPKARTKASKMTAGNVSGEAYILGDSMVGWMGEMESGRYIWK
jgi:hypothetical protein